MVVLVSGATSVMRDYPDMGVLVVPAAGNAPTVVEGRIWGMDNGGFNGVDVPLFLKMLDTYQPYRGRSGFERCRFVTAPDVLKSAAQTLVQFRQWEPTLHRYGWPVAFVGQDGLALGDVPWQSCEAVFLGGSTEWKLGRTARDLAAYAKALGKWVHMGRVNSQKRIRYAIRIGCDSVDGTAFSRWSRVFIPRVQGMVEGFEGGPLLRLHS